MEPITEAMFDHWVGVATEKSLMGTGWIIEEKCGDRIYGYFAALSAYAGKVQTQNKRVSPGSGWDLELESILGVKICLQRSHIMHSHHPYIIDNVEVEHEII